MSRPARKRRPASVGRPRARRQHEKSVRLYGVTNRDGG